MRKIILFCAAIILGIQPALLSQQYITPQELGLKLLKDQIDKAKMSSNYKTLVSIGFGYNWNNSTKSNFIFSFDFIPKISEKVFLDFKIDGIKQGQSYNVLLNIIPEYKLNFAKNSNLSGYFGLGPTIFFYPKGHPGLDASITCQAKIEYGFKNFFMNAEIRKPIFFYEDSGHIDLLSSLNFGIKI